MANINRSIKISKLPSRLTCNDLTRHQNRALIDQVVNGIARTIIFRDRAH